MSDIHPVITDSHSQDTWTVYSEVYSSVSAYESKRLLDTTIGFHIENDIPPGSIVADFGCGPALLSQTLARRGYKTIGIDRSPQMTSLTRTHFSQSFSFVNTDITQPEKTARAFFDRTKGELADAAFAINSWYATTLPEQGNLALSHEEAMEKRAKALITMALVMKEGAPIYIAEPLDTHRSLNAKAVLFFLYSEISAARARSSSISKALRHILSKESRMVMKRNKQFRPLVHLFGSTDDTTAFINGSGLFKVEEVINGPINELHYTGDVVLIKARRTSQKQH